MESCAKHENCTRRQTEEKHIRNYYALSLFPSRLCIALRGLIRMPMATQECVWIATDRYKTARITIFFYNSINWFNEVSTVHTFWWNSNINMADQSQAKTRAQTTANVILMIQYAMRFIVIKNIRLRYRRYSDMGEEKTDQSNKMDFQILVLSRKKRCLCEDNDERGSFHLHTHMCVRCVQTL